MKDQITPAPAVREALISEDERIVREALDVLGRFGKGALSSKARIALDRLTAPRAQAEGIRSAEEWYDELNDQVKYDGWKVKGPETFALIERIQQDALASRQHSAPDEESGWLCERTIEGSPHWYAIGEEFEDGFDWIKDSTKALRFARKVDAQNYIDEIGWTEVTATEHGWG